MKILVTGAGGFIGSHLVEALIVLGYDVRAFVMYNSFNSWGWLDDSPIKNRANLEIFSGDIRDPNGVRYAMKDCDVVLHLAALVAIPYSYHAPDNYVDTNIKGTLNVLQAAKDLKIKRVIHTSTSEVYGKVNYVPIDENHRLEGRSPYSASKIAADQLAYSFFASFGLPVVIVRPFNTYGPRQSARAVIPTIITQIANDVDILKLGSVSPTRDFNYIDDTVAGFISAMESENGCGEVINLGSNFEVSIAETVDLISNLMGKAVKVEADDIRVRPSGSEVERLWANNSKAKELFGWSPQYSDKSGFEKGLKKTIEWFIKKENLNRYKPNIYNL